MGSVLCNAGSKQNEKQGQIKGFVGCLLHPNKLLKFILRLKIM